MVTDSQIDIPFLEQQSSRHTLAASHRGRPHTGAKSRPGRRIILDIDVLFRQGGAEVDRREKSDTITFSPSGNRQGKWVRAERVNISVLKFPTIHVLIVYV